MNTYLMQKIYKDKKKRRVMKKTILLLIAILLLSVSIASAQEFRMREETTQNDLCSFAQQRFQVGLEIPSFLPYGNEIMNIYDTDGESIGYMQTQDNILLRMECGQEHPEPTYKIYIKDLQTIKEIMSSKNQIGALNNAKAREDVRIEGVTFDKQVTSFFTNLALSVGGWFS